MSNVDSNVTHPDCYEPEKNVEYPLCVGKGKEECKICCLWADLPGPYDDM